MLRRNFIKLSVFSLVTSYLAEPIKVISNIFTPKDIYVDSEVKNSVWGGQGNIVERSLSDAIKIANAGDTIFIKCDHIGTFQNEGL